MVMADREGVTTASGPVSVITMLGLAENLANAVLRVPFRRPLAGPSGPVQNLATNTTRQVLRSFMGYSTGLPIEEFRSMERVLDRLCGAVLPPWASVRDGVDVRSDVLGGVPGVWARPRTGSTDGTILYLHGGGYIGTSPAMYLAFVSALAKGTGCEVFVADYRLAPEFPYPAGLDDAVAVHDALVGSGVDPESLIVAGDSGGGGLATSLVVALHDAGRTLPAALVLVSPEVDLELDQRSVTDNAGRDILPWNIPVTAYLHGVEPDDARVSVVHGDAPDLPPTFVVYGADEMFRDGIRDLVAELRAAGVEVEDHEEAGMFHVFPILMPWAGASHRTFAALDAFVDRHVQPRPGGG